MAGEISEFFNPANIERLIAEGTSRRRRMQEAGAKSGGFNPISLGHWLELCREARVAVVPAISLGAIGIDTLLSDDPLAREFERGMADQMNALGAGWMARWDCCSMAETKWRLSNGEYDWAPELAHIYAEDFRALDIIADFPDQNICAWARPWMAFAVHGGWPVEYRAFVRDDALIGVSNYYPQRGLPDDDGVRADIERVTAMCQALIREQTRPLNCPRLSGFDMARNHWTADFARLPSGAVIFLEGGPPHTLTGGAHSCCFEPGNIEGVALSARWDVLGDGSFAPTPGEPNERG